VLGFLAGSDREVLGFAPVVVSNEMLLDGDHPPLSGDRHQALRNTMTELLSMDEPRQSIAAMMSGLDIH
jgi:hypothetical protein